MRKNCGIVLFTIACFPIASRCYYYVNNDNKRACNVGVGFNKTRFPLQFVPRRKVNQLTEFCPKGGWEKVSFEIPLAILMRFSGGVGHSGSEMLDANSRGQLYTFIVGAIRYNNGISAIIRASYSLLGIFQRYRRAIVNAHTIYTIGDSVHNEGTNERTHKREHVDIRGESPRNLLRNNIHYQSRTFN